MPHDQACWVCVLLFVHVHVSDHGCLMIGIWDLLLMVSWNLLLTGQAGLMNFVVEVLLDKDVTTALVVVVVVALSAGLLGF